MAFGLLGAVVGVFFILVGIFLVVIFPGVPEHQEASFSLVGVVLGFVLLILGGILLFA